MKTVAVICEYNPFHTGHAEHLRKIRAAFGEDTAIIAIMGGNYTQRGDLAIADCTVRAKAAIHAGVQLVLKLPFPFSCSSAEHFATAGVSIAERIGITDILSFGSECGDLQKLSRVASNLSSKDYADQIKKRDLSVGHAKSTELLYRKCFGDEDATVLSSPNDTLGVEYLQALVRLNSSIEPHAVLRVGDGHHASLVREGAFPSASAIRTLWMTEDFCEETPYIPQDAASVFYDEYQNGNLPVDQNRLSNVVLAFLRNILPSFTDLTVAEDGAGLYNRLVKQAGLATSLEDLVQRTRTKIFTTARIRRLIWYALLGITSSELSAPPMYTQILAMDDTGLSLLKKIKKNGEIEFLTKPADYRRLSPAAATQAALDLRADELFSLAKPIIKEGGMPYRHTPYRKSVH